MKTSLLALAFLSSMLLLGPATAVAAPPTCKTMSYAPGSSSKSLIRVPAISRGQTLRIAKQVAKHLPGWEKSTAKVLGQSDSRIVPVLVQPASDAVRAKTFHSTVRSVIIDVDVAKSYVPYRRGVERATAITESHFPLHSGTIHRYGWLNQLLREPRYKEALTR
jgi:hypothetical protein